MSAISDKFTSFWELEEASGTRVDAPGTNDLTDNNTVTQAGGKVGNAAQFTAANDEYLSIADNASLSTGDIDFFGCAWLYMDSEIDSMGVMAKLDDSVAEWEVYWLGDAFHFIIRSSIYANLGEAVTATGLSTATWYFLVWWHDATANTVNIQINNGTPVSAATSGAPTDTAASFFVGASYDSSYTWDGRIDQAGFGKTLLTADDRAWLYNDGNGRSWAEALTYGVAFQKMSGKRFALAGPGGIAS